MAQRRCGGVWYSGGAKAMGGASSSARILTLREELDAWKLRPLEVPPRTSSGTGGPARGDGTRRPSSVEVGELGPPPPPLQMISHDMFDSFWL